ncbi:SUKH-4 family immunity protein [Streptomyces pathocidini]|uniref:SUKH-4 family immunity protein n=1 Tax=Streptomyces pathocidini TaxID=1650571 RepID=UPI003F4CAF21
MTIAQARERAEQWINGGVPAGHHREVCVEEFALGFVAYAPEGGGVRLVIARDTGDATLWPDLPVEEVAHWYEEAYGPAGKHTEPDAEPAAPPQRIDLQETSFLLTPSQWLQAAADQLATPERQSHPSDTPSLGTPRPGTRPPGIPHPETSPLRTPHAETPPPRTPHPETSPLGTSRPETPPQGTPHPETSPLGTPRAETPPGTPPLGAPRAETPAMGMPNPRTDAAPPPAPPQPAPAPPPPPPAAYGYPPPPPPPPVTPAPPTQPMVGPGYMAVLRYRAHDGSEQQLIRRSTPGTPHPEWQLLYELRSLGVPPQQVLELHTELESCDLPGGYCARMVRETWPQVRISNTAPYGRDHATRQQGVRHLIEHQGELHQVADGPALPPPNRVPLPHPSQVQPMPPIPPEGIGQELLQAFGPQGVVRCEHQAVARQGVPEPVARTLVQAGLPRDFGPFFWARAQPGHPVPTLAELAAERGIPAAPDASSYLVMGNDFGKQLCVQYGTAHIVAVPLEPSPGGATPQFVSTGIPEFARSLALLGRMWRLRYGLAPEQAARWTVDFQTQLAALDPPALTSPENWWSVLLEQMWDGLL